MNIFDFFSLTMTTVTDAVKTAIKYYLIIGNSLLDPNNIRNLFVSLTGNDMIIEHIHIALAVIGFLVCMTTFIFSDEIDETQRRNESVFFKVSTMMIFIPFVFAMFPSILWVLMMMYFLLGPIFLFAGCIGMLSIYLRRLVVRLKQAAALRKQAAALREELAALCEELAALNKEVAADKKDR